MSLTTDPKDPRLKRGPDVTPTGQNEVYLVLSEEERKKGFLQPVRDTYIHEKCGVATHMGTALAETYARDPWFYGGTFCVGCQMHRPLEEFHWRDGEPMAPAQWSDEKLQAVMTRQKELSAASSKAGEPGNMGEL